MSGWSKTCLGPCKKGWQRIFVFNAFEWACDFIQVLSLGPTVHLSLTPLGSRRGRCHSVVNHRSQVQNASKENGATETRERKSATCPCECHWVKVEEWEERRECRRRMRGDGNKWRGLARRCEWQEDQRAGELQPLLMITLHLGSPWLDGQLPGGGDGRPVEQPGVTGRQATGGGSVHFFPWLHL